MKPIEDKRMDNAYNAKAYSATSETKWMYHVSLSYGASFVKLSRLQFACRL